MTIHDGVEFNAIVTGWLGAVTRERLQSVPKSGKPYCEQGTANICWFKNDRGEGGLEMQVVVSLTNIHIPF